MKFSLVVFSVFMTILSVLTPQGALAQSYPTRPIRWIVPFSPGSGSDSAARLLASKLTSHLGQQVLVDNRPGAGGVVGTELGAKASPDGYTMIWGGVAPLAINVTMMKNIPYDPMKDFIPITLIASAPLMLAVHPSVGIKSVAELIAYANKNPGKLSYASPGNGTTSHLAMELLKVSKGLSISHVPYKGTGPGIADLLGGHVQLMFDAAPLMTATAKAGKLIPLAVTSAKRVAIAQDVPTMIELGFPGFQIEPWFGALVPAGTPKDVTVKLGEAMQKVLTSADVTSVLTDQYGFIVQPTTPEQFSAFIKSETMKWAKILAATGAKAD